MRKSFELPKSKVDININGTIMIDGVKERGELSGNFQIEALKLRYEDPQGWFAPHIISGSVHFHTQAGERWYARKVTNEEGRPVWEFVPIGGEYDMDNN